MPSVWNKPVFHILSGFRACRIAGPDARDFLQRMTTADFKKLAKGSSSDATFLTATGKTLAWFKTAVLDDSYLLLCAPVEAGKPSDAATFEALEKFHFMENLTITALGGEYTAIRLAFSGAEPVLPAGTVLFKENKWKKSPWEVATFDTELVAAIPTASFSNAKSALLAAGFTDLGDGEGMRILMGTPTAPNEVNPMANPLEVGLGDAVHENKGCYPGQEVIEKIRALGDVPKKLVALRGDGAAPATPGKISFLTQEAGAVTSTAIDPTDPSKWVGLGLMKKMYAQEAGNAEFNVAGSACQVVLLTKEDA